MQFIQDVNVEFWKYINNYNTNNTNILRKIIHSFTVANTSFDIACRFNMSEKERNFCYLLGLLHDIGRFEQWKLYETYDDNKSENHGNIGKRMLKTFNMDSLHLNKNELNLLSNVIKYHAQPYSGNNKTIKKYLGIIHNADAYANVITTANASQQLFTENNGYTLELLNKFYSGERLYSYSTHTKVDRLLKLLSGINNVEIDFLRRDIIDKNYIEIIYSSYSKFLNNSDKKIFRDATTHLKNTYKV